MTKESKWFNKKWWVSPFNYSEKILKSFILPGKVYVRDSTIREGEETPGIYYTLEQKIKIVEKLEDIGVGHIDCGYIGQVQD
ncbi:MAG: hypothetical protein KAX18_12870, partial [Candidatus Lokiarchaeota archaeon]|nr:hypothetical protein [Candidatus Lokiarchaeota archaeon]